MTITSWPFLLVLGNKICVSSIAVFKRRSGILPSLHRPAIRVRINRISGWIMTIKMTYLSLLRLTFLIVTTCNRLIKYLCSRRGIKNSSIYPSSYWPASSSGANRLDGDIKLKLKQRFLLFNNFVDNPSV